MAQTYARQARLVAGALARSKTLPPSPPMTSDLSLVNGADVLLIFIESYGAIAFERPDMAPQLAAARADLDQAIHATGRDVVSALVESPTFGGSSWLAHISLLSGVEVRDPDTNARLMTEKRGTVITTFARHGYRTVAMMPGLRQLWPEGSFYGFDDIYGAAQVDYHGPEFGWFALPDQFSLAKFDALEPRRRRARRCSCSTRRSARTFRSAQRRRTSRTGAGCSWRSRTTARPSCALTRNSRTGRISGRATCRRSTTTTRRSRVICAAQPDHDLIMILLGDHQPPALVSGEGAPWDVPVHVIASRPEVLEATARARLQQRPHTLARPSLGHMHTLLPTLQAAFSSP